MPQSRLPRRPCAVLVGLLLIGLAGCASGPDFQTLDARVIFAQPPELSDDAVLNVTLKDRDDGATLAESRYTHFDTTATRVTLQYAQGAIDTAHTYVLQADVRDRGRLTHLNRERVDVFNGETGTTPTVTLVPVSHP
ncbi:type III secretion system (T3SS) chaperone YscW [Chromohalobacter marismortui]|uniref:Type III secretion system (T3SS) chaperone YscW n=1 Tax=Chromohalobacter marismortui TaxID=42055 RepID=A0A4R7NMF1_9GAMM|nr:MULTISPECIES: YbaY family lipoprotein [Chromohalobacter]MCI0509741.1 YbaY family lipoprotein [Chromohalobacter sp.]MCI0593296.1 YbaY family lipoprotein [Chromohalobacter sp.]TDU21963.1 type III secretion system (T3SS) chaperone YscW [Chromohalobacter marismortui]